MNAEHLVKMTNEISAFFVSEVGGEKAAREVCNHLKRFWDPRMRKAMLAHFDTTDGAGLDDAAKAGVALLAQEVSVARQA